MRLLTAAAPVAEADSYALLALGMGLVGRLARRRRLSRSAHFETGRRVHKP